MKGIFKRLIFPHMAIMLILLPISVVFLVYSMLYEEKAAVISISSYLLSAYTLTVWCFKLPYLIRFFTRLKNDNKYARRWLEDAHLRVKVSLYASLIWNVIYSVLQLWLGFYHKSFWFVSMACYYISLAVMRFFLLLHARKNVPGEKMAAELRKYIACGWVFLIVNLALSLMVFFMVYWNRTFEHHQITVIAMAAYTFTAFSLAIVNIVKYRKYNSPVYSAAKAISLAAASVSVLTLESTMLTTFGEGTMDLLSRRIFLGATGGAVSVFIIVMAIYMIACGRRKLKNLYFGEN